jgi:ribosomal protein L11 methyltransferase
MPTQWIRLDVTIDPSDRERLEGLLLDWETLGFEERSATALTAHFTGGEQEAEVLRSACETALASPPFSRAVRWEVSLYADEDWTIPAREHFKGVDVAGALSILPPWAPADHPLSRREIALRIDPGQAFGTGTHETTRLMLGWMLDHLQPGQSVLDVGAGSCVLSIAAVKMGAQPVTAVEIDPVAEENARLNLTLNGVADQVDLHIANFTRLSLEAADLVLCNILIELFEPHLERLRDLTLPGGILCLGGFLVIDEMALRENLRGLGLEELACRQEGEWSSLCLRKR